MPKRVSQQRKMKKIMDMAKEDRPYEKCLRLGAEALSDGELLAVLLRTGTKGCPSVDMADEILNLSKDREGLLGPVSVKSGPAPVCKRVWGRVKAVQIKCIGELSKRIATATARKGLSFNQPETIAEYYMERLRHEEQELLICMMLDTKNHLLGEEMVFKGTVNSSLVNPREIFLAAVSYHAVGILLVHNHPSGDPTPQPGRSGFYPESEPGRGYPWDSSDRSYYHRRSPVPEFSPKGDFLMIDKGEHEDAVA